MTERNEPCWCGSNKKWKKCHFPVDKPKDITKLYRRQYGILIKSEKEIAGIRTACQFASQTLDKLCSQAIAGITTEELNQLSDKLHKDAGATPATIGYGNPPYQKGICTSINEVVCHGIPDQTKLKDGDIINIDVASILNGYYGDCSQMVVVGGKTTDERQLVTDVSHECLMQSIAILKPGVLVSQIGEVIENHAHKRGCSVVHQFVAHGVGVQFHEGPQIPHCKNQVTIPLVPGMTFTIEPMINAGVPEAVIDLQDQWTARTKDSKPSGQWEHTLLITETGHEILTPWTRKP